jgi:hypothetical protein
MTGGRTGAESQIALEAHVIATPLGARMSDQFRWEAAEIIVLTEIGTAVIELAALLDVPIGVVRVLVGDLAEMGAVIISNPAAEVVAQGGEDYATLLQKVLDGIKSI